MSCGNVPDEQPGEVVEEKIMPSMSVIEPGLVALTSRKEANPARG
jgi:hypothetical protein